jgi:transcriptional regulator with XRE-family HTH domain
VIRGAAGEAQFARALAALLRDIRVESGISQEALAAELGLDQAAVSRVESGHRRLSVSDLFHWAEALGHDPRELAVRAADLWAELAAGPGSLWTSSEDDPGPPGR